MTYREHKGKLVPTYSSNNANYNTNPLDKKTAKDYFEALYEKSLKPSSYYNICFLGWVNPKTFQPIEEVEELNKGMDYQFEKNKLYAHLGDKLVKELKEYKCFIAGGTITSLFCNREINDIDVYFRDEESLIQFIEDSWSSGWVITNTKKATLVKFQGKDVQLIHFDYFKNAQEIFDTFDFTVCMGAFDFADEKFYLHNDFLKHNSQRILIFNKNTSYPIVSLLRVQKYKDKGYTISKPEMLRIVMTCMKLNITTLSELKEQIGGMYGVNYDRLFEGESEDFSLENAIDKIENLSLDDDYFKAPEFMEFEDAEEIIDEIRKQPIKFFKINDVYYRIRTNGTIKKSNNKPKNGIEIDAGNKLSNMKLYKFVKNENNTYRSYYDSKFEYKIGEIAIPQNRSYGTPLLYFNELKEINESPFNSRKDKALLEVEFEVDDFYSKDGSQITLKKCKVIREVPKEEYQQYLDDEQEDDDPFA
ncbi:hypothetical protein IJ22_17120 [Paenibacillus naphthalenovorans]|uniref:Uncharacterized protein n=2 Tax=Paenibacillus naphthalenovorans TaxID=162209 RepID=A0A0U2VMZ1_9BACL|nr:hypothetical protein IJ22_17120 [Paenibacillus naphthalenovorans]